MKQNETDTALTKKQRDTAEMLADPEFSGNKTELLKKAGVSRSTLYRWLKDSEFVNYVNELIDLYADGELGAVWKALINRCKAGDVQAIKLYFEIKGKYRQRIEHNADDLKFEVYFDYGDGQSEPQEPVKT